MEVLCAAGAGITARFICHPLDTIKTVTFTGFAGDHCSGKVTSPHALSPFGSRFVQSARSIYAREGLRGYFRGIGVSVVGAAPGVALYLTSYDYFSSTLTAVGKTDGAPSSTRTFSERVVSRTPDALLVLLSGFLAEAVSCLVWVPIDVSKERLQSQPPSLRGRYLNSFDALRTISRNEGLLGLYRGYFSTLGSFGPFSALYFVGYEWFTARAQPLMQHMPCSDAAKSFFVAMLAGAGGNILASLCTNPLELVKTRLQVQRAILNQSAATAAGGANTNHASSKRLYHYRYHGLVDGIRTMARTEGVTALWNGVGCRMGYTVPNAALTMAFYEYLKTRFTPESARG